MLILAGHQLIKCCVRGFNKLIFRYCVYTHMVSRLSLGLFQRKLITTLGAIAIFAHSNLTQTTGLPYLKFPTGYKVFRSATTDMYKTKEPMLFLCACNFSWMQEPRSKDHARPSRPEAQWPGWSSHEADRYFQTDESSIYTWAACEYRSVLICDSTQSFHHYSILVSCKIENGGILRQKLRLSRIAPVDHWRKSISHLVIK